MTSGSIQNTEDLLSEIDQELQEFRVFKIRFTKNELTKLEKLAKNGGFNGIGPFVRYILNQL